MTTELGRLIARRIALTGPISIADFMAEALGHPRLGYYRRALPVGAAGDFTTAPEISQMFGELIGAWLAERWLAMGAPSPVQLIELGPGRGTLMADALRATRGVPGFHRALRLHLVDTNAPLRAEQQRALGAFAPVWHERFDEVPPGPALIVANEFFDALPVRQFQKTARGWRERMVG
ncbi:MAG TPA: SAM-dependent methyltransferase, partial [Reyranella sp.]|nr:SAM-dependent methyltransferase [Reyranella sp.]